MPVPADIPGVLVSGVVPSIARGGLTGPEPGGIGVGLGAIVRNREPTLVGITVWTLFIANSLVGDLGGVESVSQFQPGSVARAVSGIDQVART